MQGTQAGRGRGEAKASLTAHAFSPQGEPGEPGQVGAPGKEGLIGPKVRASPQQAPGRGRVCGGV